jgi:hypothetical protein
MNYLKIMCGAIGLFTFQGALAATCSSDRIQMFGQISRYGSISTEGCPFNILNWGIVHVSEPLESSDNACTATCTYGFGPGSEGKPCVWKLGRWAETLICY